jgi:tetratricopeptide (TPR) repeat protein
MMFEWFNAREATEVGTALASQLAPQITAARDQGSSAAVNGHKALRQLLERVDREVRSLRLNVYKRAKLANSFRWGLLENGVATAAAHEITQLLLLHLLRGKTLTTTAQMPPPVSSNAANAVNVGHLFVAGNKHFAQGAYDKAIVSYQNLIATCPNHADGLTNLGAAFCKIGRYRDGGDLFRQAIEIQPNSSDALSNLGTLLLWMGQLAAAEILLRRALKLKPRHIDAQNSLGLAFILLGRSRDARARFQKVLRAAPRNAHATYGIGQAARMEGRFEEAEAMFGRALEFNPKMPGPLAGLAGIRRMQSSDRAWLERAETMAASRITPLQEADIRFALGKYWDDVGSFERAFENYHRANELQRTGAERYDRKARTRFVNDLKSVYTKENLSAAHAGLSSSTKPVFIVGMMRSGTSLVEQIVASHPDATGAGELGFWSHAVTNHEVTIRKEVLDGSTRGALADKYLRVLSEHSANALRVVDKAPINSDYLGVIHSVFPNARIVYMRRNPIDTCLSCYFQQFLPCHDFAMDLSDLAHYYREHHGLVEHWRAVLPPGTMLDVPYEELVADQEGWTRKILDFLDLKWDARCLQFHETRRQVATASYWQVRQKMFPQSVGRWRNYEKFIGPLRGLAALDR